MQRIDKSISNIKWDWVNKTIFNKQKKINKAIIFSTQKTLSKNNLKIKK